METILELPSRFQEADQLAKATLREIISRLPFKPTPLTLDSDSEILTDRLQKKFMWIEDGRVSCVRSNILLFIFTSGDLIGLDYMLSMTDLRLQTTFAVPVQEIPKDIFFKAIESNKDLQSLWCRYLGFQLDMMSLIVGDVMKGEFDPGTTIKTFREGEIIIQQGDTSTEVFTLVDGHAIVQFNDTQVGEIGQNEIFGALSALGGVKRTASVIAKTTCVVVAMPKEHFVEFFKSRPAAVLKMVEDMAINMVKLNQRVADSNQGSLSKTHT